MSTKSINCIMEFDDRSNVVTIRSRATGTIQLMIKLEACAAGTMTRINLNEDCDNFWIGVKPADSVVFEDRLFGTKQVQVEEFKFSLK